jgi:hypothetical protein
MISTAVLGVGLGVLSQVKILAEARAYRQPAISIPSSTPTIGQESIDRALKIFHIEIPRTADHPRYNPKLHDRGAASRRFGFQKIQVEVGPSAFQSWSLLASTLAHELEVHCRQNWALINVMDSMGLHGSMWAERQAYLYEIKNAERFGLDTRQIELIEATMAYFYDVDQREGTTFPRRMSAKLGRWFARSIYLQ